MSIYGASHLRGSYALQRISMYDEFDASKLGWNNLYLPLGFTGGVSMLGDLEQPWSFVEGY